MQGIRIAQHEALLRLAAAPSGLSKLGQRPVLDLLRSGERNIDVLGDLVRRRVLNLEIRSLRLAEQSLIGQGGGESLTHGFQPILWSVWRHCKGAAIELNALDGL